MPRWVPPVTTSRRIAASGTTRGIAGLSADQRAALYDRDFGDMHRRGDDTIEGWFENQFESVTLDAAARNGIGVLMPFKLKQDWDYARLQDIITRWPAQWPGRQLVISEYAPGGMSPVDRPLGFQQEWQIISSRPNVVLGGPMAYTWATNGPEDLDRVFGLVDTRWESDRRRAERAGHGVRRRRTVTRYYSGPAGSLPAETSVVTERGDRVNWPMPSRSVRRPSLSARCVRSVVVTTSDG